jgi:hypothetical protein
MSAKSIPSLTFTESQVMMRNEVNQFRLHHFGVIVRDFSLIRNGPIRLWPWIDEKAIDARHVHEPGFQSQIQLLPLIGHPLQFIEIIQPDNSDSPLHRFLGSRSAIWHHLAFEVQDLRVALQLTERARMLTVVQPTPSTVFKGRRVAFVIGEDQLLWELVESDSPK